MEVEFNEEDRTTARVDWFALGLVPSHLQIHNVLLFYKLLKVDSKNALNRIFVLSGY